MEGFEKAGGLERCEKHILLLVKATSNFKMRKHMLLLVKATRNFKITIEVL